VFLCFAVTVLVVRFGFECGSVMYFCNMHLVYFSIIMMIMILLVGSQSAGLFPGVV